MQTYNNIMLYFWLVCGIILTVGVTYMSITDDFMKWRYYFVFPVLCFGMYVMRRYMMKRFERHSEWLEQNKKGEGN